MLLVILKEKVMNRSLSAKLCSDGIVVIDNLPTYMITGVR